MKKLLVVLAVLFTGILLAGCTSQQAAPVATPVPTAVPTTVVPTAAPTVIPTTAPVVVVNATPNVTVNATPNATPTPQPAVTITFNADLTISPGTTVYIPAGGEVIWQNNDPYKPHGIQAVNLQTGQYFGSMNGVMIPYGKSLDVTFPTAGAFDYTTVYQPHTSGKIIVTAQ
jgi:plastocyanin